MANAISKAIEAIDRLGEWTVRNCTGWDNEAYSAAIDAREALKAEQSSVETLARWMLDRGYSTGHGDTVEDLLLELDGQIQQAQRAGMVPNGWHIHRYEQGRYLVIHPDGSQLVVEDGQLGRMAHIFNELCEAITAAKEQGE